MTDLEKIYLVEHYWELDRYISENIYELEHFNTDNYFTEDWLSALGIGAAAIAGVTGLFFLIKYLWGLLKKEKSSGTGGNSTNNQEASDITSQKAEEKVLNKLETLVEEDKKEEDKKEEDKKEEDKKEEAKSKIQNVIGLLPAPSKNNTIYSTWNLGGEMVGIDQNIISEHSITREFLSNQITYILSLILKILNIYQDNKNQSYGEILSNLNKIIINIRNIVFYSIIEYRNLIFKNRTTLSMTECNAINDFEKSYDYMYSTISKNKDYINLFKINSFIIDKDEYISDSKYFIKDLNENEKDIDIDKVQNKLKEFEEDNVIDRLKNLLKDLINITTLKEAFKDLKVFNYTILETKAKILEFKENPKQMEELKKEKEEEKKIKDEIKSKEEKENKLKLIQTDLLKNYDAVKDSLKMNKIKLKTLKTDISDNIQEFIKNWFYGKNFKSKYSISQQKLDQQMNINSILNKYGYKKK